MRAVAPASRDALTRAWLALATALRRPGRRSVPIDRLLLGPQAGRTARQFAEQTGDLMWPSTPLTSGPHVALLRLAERRDGSLTDQEILASDYGRLALGHLALRGSFRGATDAARVARVARSFAALYGRGTPDAGVERGRDGPIVVAPVRGSSCYQVLAGHHRLAAAAAEGLPSSDVAVSWIPVQTPLQRRLRRMSRADEDGVRALEHPLPAPELRQGWVLVRRCEDRADKMRRFLDQRGLLPPATSTYLDVGSCYGWFVARMRDLGYEARGIELNPSRVEVGLAAYRLHPSAISIGDCIQLLRGRERTARDVTSCLSVLHHFVQGRGSASAEELLRALDAVTGGVLFLDTGQEDEGWNRHCLRGWTPTYIAEYLRAHTTFDEIVDLGPDQDRVAEGPYAGCYGRHLFACVRG